MLEFTEDHNPPRLCLCGSCWITNPGQPGGGALPTRPPLWGLLTPGRTSSGVPELSDSSETLVVDDSGAGPSGLTTMVAGFTMILRTMIY